MNWVWKFFGWTLCLNFASILMIMMIPSMSNPTLNPFSANTINADTFTNGMSGSIDPNGVRDPSNVFNRLIDRINIGWIGKVIGAFGSIDNILFGVVNLVKIIFGEGFPVGLDILLKSIISLGYVFGIFWLWTNRSIFENTG